MSSILGNGNKSCCGNSDHSKIGVINTTHAQCHVLHLMLVTPHIYNDSKQTSVLDWLGMYNY